MIFSYIVYFNANILFVREFFFLFIHPENIDINTKTQC